MSHAKLSGAALLEHMNKGTGIPLADLVKGAGYWRKNGTHDDGSDRITIRYAEFWASYAAAQGHAIVDAKLPTGPRKPGGVLKVGRKNLVPLSGAYTKVLDVEPGDHAFIDTIEAGEEKLIVGPAVICRNSAHVQDPAPEPAWDKAPRPAGVPDVLRVA